MAEYSGEGMKNMRNPEQGNTFQSASLDNKGVFPLATVEQANPASEVTKSTDRKPIKPSRRALYARLAKVLLAIATIVGPPATYHHVNYESELNFPAVGRDISSVPGFYLGFGKSTIDDLLGLFNKEAHIIIPPDVFDNKALGGTISSENKVSMSSEEIKETFPSIIIDSANNTSTILFPFQLPEGTNAQFAKTIVVPKDNPGGFSNQTEEVAILEILLPLGTKIVNPIEGAHVSLLMGNPKLKEDPNLVVQANFYWYDEANDRLYRFSITPRFLPGPMFKPLIQGDEYYKAPYDWENMPVANRGLEIMETTQDSQAIVVDVTIYRGRTNNLDAIMKNFADKTLRRGEVNFFVQDTGQGKTKLVALENQN